MNSRNALSEIAPAALAILSLDVAFADVFAARGQDAGAVVTDVFPIAEPATLLVLGVGFAALGWSLRRKRRNGRRK